MNSNATLMNTPEKCGCAGGIVVSRSMDESAQNKPKSRRSKKQTRSLVSAERSQEKTRNVSCGAAKSANRIGTDGNCKLKTPPTASGTGRESPRKDGVAEKKWYTSAFRGALGRWSTKGKSRGTVGKEMRIMQEQSSESSSQISNSCTNNNCKASGKCNMDEDSPCSNEAKMQSQAELSGNAASDPNLSGHRILDTGEERKDSSRITTRIGDKTSDERPHAGASSVRVRRAHGPPYCTNRRPKSDSGPRLKLPSLPYREHGNSLRGTASVKPKDKRQRSKKRFLSSPVHREENSRGRQKGQSTYVSFQDDFAEDVYLNVEAQKGIISASASPVTERSGSSDSALQVSPSSLADDVFTESYANDGGKRPKSVHSGISDITASREEIEDERIAKLFQKVNSAFDRNQPRSSETPKTAATVQVTGACSSENGSLSSAATVEYTKNKIQCSVKSKTKFQDEYIETIMANANLHASLDNALSILSESTKLLSQKESPGWGSRMHSTRHQSCGGVLRSRTYSTCSRLEPIAEENDKADETMVDGKYVGDATSCSDSSEYEKFNFPNSRLTQHGITSPRMSATSKFSLGNQQKQISQGCQANNPAGITKDLNTKLNWLTSSSHIAPRKNSTSTISVRSLLRKRGSYQGNACGPTQAENCAACEWAISVHLPLSVSVIPYSSWRQIVKGGCQDHAHFHPWGICGDQGSTPVLCHSHYLQYYQHLQNDQMTRGHGDHSHSASSSQADSIIDYDIHEITSHLDELVESSTENTSSVQLRHTRFQRNEHCLLDNGPIITGMHSNIRSHFMDVQLGKGPYKQSDTDVSANSDSAFSTNGSPTSSLRDGVNTDRESIGSLNEKTEADERGIGKLYSFRNDPWTYNEQHLESYHLEQSKMLGVNNHHNSSRGIRIQSYDDAKPRKDLTKCTAGHQENRYSLASSLCSYSSPLTSDQLCDSAVQLQDSSSSRSTHLSSDSFYSSGTSFGDKETCLIDGTNYGDVLSRSSSEASLQSEGTLCLSEFAMSQHNISLYSAPSFPHITDLCSPKRQDNLKHPALENETVNHFDNWVKKTKVTESKVETYLAQTQQNVTSITESNAPFSDKPSSNTSCHRNTDTLTSSSGSSDTNTLGSGSSTYATSSLRSYSRFNTLDSSSCISTDDTGETVIDQNMLRPGGRLHNIEETESTAKHHRVRRKRSSEARVRYQPSAFHYQNLEAPSFLSELEVFHHECEESNVYLEKGEAALSVTKDLTKTTQITMTRSRSSSMSCVMTSFIKTACLVRQSKSLPCICLSQVTDQRSVKIVEVCQSTLDAEPMIDFSKSISPRYGRVLQSKVHSMMQNCSDIDSVIASLRESLKSVQTKETETYLDMKLLQLARILKQKDEMIKHLHQMLLACSMPERPIGNNYQLNATM